VRELRPAADAEELGWVGVPKDARLLLREDAVARERAQQPVQRVRIHAGGGSELVDVTRPVTERFLDAQVRDDRERPGSQCAAQKLPDLRLRRDLAHPRAAATESAT
jgi:hypothetical protein